MQVTIWPRGSARPFEAATSGAGAAHVTDFGEILEVEYSTRYESGFGGHDLATVTVKPFGGFLGGLFRPGDHGKIVKGGGVGFEGEVSGVRPDQNDSSRVQILLKGYAYNLEDYQSIYFESVPLDDDISYPTNQLVGGDLEDTWYGWEYAIARGMPIAQVVGAIPTGSFGESPIAEQPLTVATLMTAMTQEQGQKWQVLGRTLIIAADDLTPVWGYDAPVGLVGVEDTDYYTHVGAWHVTADPATDPANWLIGWAGGNSPDTSGMAWGNTPAMNYFDTRQIVVDYRGLGVMTTPRAQDLAEALWEQVKGRFVLTGSFTVGPLSGFRSAGGGIADIAFPRAGQALQMNQLRTSQGTMMPDSTFVIGRTEYRWSLDGEESLTVTPLWGVPRNLGELLRGVPLDAASVVAGAT